MRARVVGLTLVGLGGGALAVAVSLGTVLAGPWSASVPVELALDESFSTVAAGEVTYLDPGSLTERTGDDVSLTVRVRGDAASGDAGGDTAVWVAESATSDTDGTLLGTTTTVACLDRRSAEAQDCAAESVDGAGTDVRGLTVAFPPDTPQRDAEVWDATVGEALPARYTGTEELGGLEVYRFEQEVPAQAVGAVSVPGALVGGVPGTVAAEVWHRADRTLLVEPVSGVVVSTRETLLTVLRGTDGTPGAVLLAGTLTTTDASAADAAGRAREVRDRRELTGTVLPWTLGGTGAALTVLGGLLVLRRRPAAAAPREDEPVRVPVPTA